MQFDAKGIQKYARVLRERVKAANPASLLMSNVLPDALSAPHFGNVPPPKPPLKPPKTLKDLMAIRQPANTPRRPGTVPPVDAVRPDPQPSAPPPADPNATGDGYHHYLPWIGGAALAGIGGYGLHHYLSQPKKKRRAEDDESH